MKVLIFLKIIIINTTIFLLERIITKKSKNWIFGMDDGGGSKFSANAWYLLEYIIKEMPEVTPICCTSSDELIKNLTSRNIIFYRPHTLSSIKYALISKVYIICGELHHEIPNFSRHQSLFINLWHGVPLKKIFYSSPKMMDRLDSRPLRMKITDFLRGKVNLEEYKSIVYTTDNFKEIMTTAFNNPNLSLTGQPRDDIFYIDFDRTDFLKSNNLNELENKTIITYLPTFRDSKDKKNNYKAFQNNQKAKQYLIENNITIIQKDHNPIETTSYYDGPVLHLADFVNTQELLSASDIIITDYSSVFIDYLHTQKPIIFYPYDIDSYLQNDRGLYFDYNDDLITPGKKPTNESELLKVIKNYQSDSSLDSNLRKLSFNFYQHHQDGKNSERTAISIKEKVQL